MCVRLFIQMIYYYSATGNSRYAALSLARRLLTKAIDIISPEASETVPEEGESIGFVFPVYCWGVPPVVKAFITQSGERLQRSPYVWSVCTCGDEAGIAMKVFSHYIKKLRGTGADALFSLIMPNTYVLLPGFDVDKKAVEEKKLSDAPGRIEEISLILENRTRGVYDVHQGTAAALRTRLIFPLFRRWGISPKLWHAAETCIGCAKCSRICPAHNIVMENGRPEWGKNCYSCCACFHICPVKAVGYGKLTRGKSQYIFPNGEDVLG